MLRVETAVLPPFACGVCSASTGPFVDTLIELATGGRLVLCESCVRAAGAALGADRALRAQLTATQAEWDATKAELEAARDEHEELQRAVALTLQQGAVTKQGRIVLRQRRARSASKASG